MLTFARAHRPRHHRLLVAALSAAVVTITFVGCGSVKPAPDTFETRAASASAERACGASAVAICERARTCSGFLFRVTYPNFATCTAMVAEQCVDRYRGEGTAKEIADCSSAVASLTCEQLTAPLYGSEYETLQLLWSCPVTPGVFGAGERCLRDGDCTTGSCGRHEDCGRCEAPVAPTMRKGHGEPCTDPASCASESCSAGKCDETAKLGEPCNGRACDLLAGLACDGAVCAPYPRIPLGSRCSLFDLCEEGATCAGDLLGSAGSTCKTASTAGVGDDCSRGCPSALDCVNGKCAAVPYYRPSSCQPAAQK